VKRERLEDFLENALHTKRFAHYVGKRCRSGTIKDVAEELNLDWHTVKRLEKQYMREQLRRAGTPRPKVIGVDEISVRKGHEYRIVVSDLEKHRPIWFGGTDRSEQSMDEFYRFLGEKPAQKVRLAVMDMWKPFRNSTLRNAPQAAICLASTIPAGGDNYSCRSRASLNDLPQAGLPPKAAEGLVRAAHRQRQHQSSPEVPKPARALVARCSATSARTLGPVNSSTTA